MAFPLKSADNSPAAEQIPPHVEFAGHYRASHGDVDMHAHPVLELVYITRGTCISTLEYLPPLRGGAGMCFILPPCTPHDQTGDCDTHFINLRLSASEYPQVPQVLDLRNDPFPDEWFAVMPEFFCQQSHAETDALAAALWFRIRNLYLKQNPQRPQATAYTSFAVEFIQRHYRESITVAQLARIARVSPGYLNRCFQAEFGRSTMGYLYDFRLKIAVQLLNSPYLNVAEIAADCGFSGANYFIRAFRKKYGCTPGAYRKKNICLACLPEASAAGRNKS